MARFFILLALFSGGSFPALPGEIASETSFTASYWLGGKLRFGKWNTIWLHIQTGENPFRGEFVYRSDWGSVQRTHRLPVDVAERSEVRLPFYVLTRGSSGRLFFRARERPEKERAINLTALGSIQEEALTVGVIGAAPAAIGLSHEFRQRERKAEKELLKKLQERWMAVFKKYIVNARRQKPFAWGNAPTQRDEGLEYVPAPANLLPDRERGLNALDALVWVDPDFSVLSPARRDALHHWVAGGGALIVIPGRRWRELRNAPLEELGAGAPLSARAESDWSFLLPAPTKRKTPHPRSEISRAPNFLQPDFRPSHSPEGTAIHYLLPGGTSDLRLPWHEKPVGFGRILTFSFNPTEKPFHDWQKTYQGLDPVWAHALRIRDNVESQASRQFGWLGQGRVPSLSLGAFSGVKMIPFGTILLFLAGYVLLIGPVDFFVLKKLKRLEWTWFTFPAVVALMCGISVYWATAWKGQLFVSNSFTVLDLPPGEKQGTASEWVNLFCPRATTIEVRGPGPGSQVGEAGLANQTSFADYAESKEGARLRMPTRQWAVTSFRTRYARNVEGGLRLEPGATGLRLVNHTGLAFSRYVLWEGGKGAIHGRELKNEDSASLILPPPNSRVQLNISSPNRWSGPNLILRNTVGNGDPHLLGSPCESLTVRSRGAPDFFPFPGRAARGDFIFMGFTSDVDTTYRIKGEKVKRKHVCLVRTILRRPNRND